jgi:hypothetical protein
MSRPILLAALVLSMSGCVGSPTAPRNEAAKAATASGPNYAGNWSGNYAITDCRQSLEVGRANICGALGDSAPYSLSIAQNTGGVTVSVTLGDIRFPGATAKIRSDGSVGLSTATTSNGFNVVAELTLTIPETILAGTINQLWTSSTMPGKATVNGRITTAVRTP